MTIRRRIRIAAPLLAVCLAGCSLFSRPDNHFYSLRTIAPEARILQANGAPIAINGVQLPPTLDRRGIVIRGADNSLDVRGTHQWAAPLEAMVLHTLAFDLADRLPEGMVVLPGQTKPSGAARSVFVILEELAPGPEPRFILDGRWTISGAGVEEVTHHERISIDLGSLESDEVADGMSRALAMLADLISAQLSSK